MRHWILSAMLLVGCPALVLAGGPQPEYTASERSHWSFLPLQKTVPPRPHDPALRGQVRTAVDAYVFRRLEEQGLRPAAAAEPTQLLRRITFDLTGLPPTPADISAPLPDFADRVARLVDRLLASPRYGEKWGQHWLDVVRFAESEGFEYDRTIRGAWRFRDYVIDSFNDDKPYDRFVLEQLAGDEIGPTDLRLQTAAGFHRLGPVRRNAGNAEVAFSRNEVLTERTNIVGAAFLGVTLACARCHDHMFDPIRQRDYYQFQAFMAGTFEHDVVLASDQAQRQRQHSTKAVRVQIEDVKAQLEQAPSVQQELRLKARLMELERQLPPPLPVIATVREIEDQRQPIHLLERGDPDYPGQVVAPRALGVLLPENAAQRPPDPSAPKLALAKWIANDNHPLTARVIANRVWQYHFGRGLVPTPNDFGANGESPSHPELLDYLAGELIAHDWSIKALHRLILLSATYWQASATPLEQQGRQQDPENYLLWKFPRRRLTAPEIRDAMLSAAGQLDFRMRGPSVMVPVDPDLVQLLYKPSQWQVSPDRAQHHRRSIYLIAKRNLQLPFLEVFDQPDLQTSCPRRESSTHAPQALELLNGSLANELAGSLAERLLREGGDAPGGQIDRGFLLTTGRRPEAGEAELAQHFLQENPLSEFALALFNLNAFLYVD